MVMIIIGIVVMGTIIIHNVAICQEIILIIFETRKVFPLCSSFIDSCISRRDNSILDFIEGMFRFQSFSPHGIPLIFCAAVKFKRTTSPLKKLSLTANKHVNSKQARR